MGNPFADEPSRLKPYSVSFVEPHITIKFVSNRTKTGADQTGVSSPIPKLTGKPSISPYTT